VLPRLLVIAVFLGLVSAAPAAATLPESGAQLPRSGAQLPKSTAQLPKSTAQLQEQTLLMPGVTYERRVEFTLHGPVVLNVITAPRPDGSLYKLEPLLSNGAIVATDRLSAIERSMASEGTVAAVNGDYFNADPGDLKGVLIRDGVLDSPPTRDRSSAGVAADGALEVARVAFAGIWKGTGQRRATTINQNPSLAGVSLYTPDWGPTTPPESGAVTEAVIPALPPTRPNRDLSGTVSQLGTAGGVSIPPGGAVLVARGSQAPILAREAPPGTALFLRMSLTPDWSGMVSAIGGGPLLVQDGKPIFRADEAIAGSLLNPRASRSAVGQLADGRIVLVTVDGGVRGYSVGMTNFELALALRGLGAVSAMALGSGPSASMVFDGTVLSRLRSPAEPQIADALGVVYTGVYVPPLPSDVISPNGDGVDDTLQLSYRLVRPATVSAAVVGNGTRQTLDSGAEQPGDHTFTFTGTGAGGAALTEGAYTFTVTATDDQGRTSTAERQFALNDTLASLSADPAAVKLSASSRSALVAAFTLSRPAQVLATIETRSGIVIRTLVTSNMQAGMQRLVWDGRNATGSLAYGGAYLVRVRATNAIGEVELTQPFTARR
jgi:flagellar hook assembly protein FlgD